MAALLYSRHPFTLAPMSLESPPYQYADSPYAGHYPPQHSSQWYAGSPEYSDYMNVPHAHGREALTKATKDLMALDADRWRPSSAMHSHSPVQNHMDYAPRQSPYFEQRLSGYDNGQPVYPQHHQRRTVTFPFLSRDRSHSLPQGRVSEPISIPPLHTLGSDQLYHSGNGYPGSPPNTGSSTSSSGGHFAFSAGHSRSSPIPFENARVSRSPSAPILPSKRGTYEGSMPTKRIRASSSAHSSVSPRPSTSQSSSSSSPSNKPTLLSASQKKANHIQSEQKRRANIRRGYEALCDTVPSLREAIKAEEMAQATSQLSLDGDRKGKRSRKGKDESEKSDKQDGRAGPRSENVVLVKTIDYISEMMAEKDDLSARLKAAQAKLSSNPAVLASSPAEPLWEREWKGGEGAEGSEDDEEDD